MIERHVSLYQLIEIARVAILEAFGSDDPRVRADAVRWLDALCDTAKGLAGDSRDGYRIDGKVMSWVMGDGKHDGTDDKETDHLDKGSDGHTVESGDEK